MDYHYKKSVLIVVLLWPLFYVQHAVAAFLKPTTLTLTQTTTAKQTTTQTATPQQSTQSAITPIIQATAQAITKPIQQAVQNIIQPTTLSVTQSTVQPTTTKPAWYNQIDDILVGINGITSTFKADKLLYTNWIQQLDELTLRVIDYTKQRKELYAALKIRFTDAQKTIATLNLTLQDQAAAAKALQTELEDRIIVLKKQTSEEIDMLKKAQADLTTQLQAAREAYATLAEFNESKVIAFLNGMQLAKDAYADMTAERNRFLDELKEFTDVVRAMLLTGKDDDKDLLTCIK